MLKTVNNMLEKINYLQINAGQSIGDEINGADYTIWTNYASIADKPNSSSFGIQLPNQS